MTSVPASAASSSTKERYIDILKRDGVVVIPDVLSREECAKYLAMMKATNQAIVDGVNVLMGNKFIKRPYFLHGQMVQYIGHTQWQWELRSDPRIQAVARDLLEVDKEEPLLCSFDGYAYCDESHTKLAGKQEGDIGSFIHTDERPNLSAKQQTTQILINLTDTLNKDLSAGFVACKGSHLQHGKIWERALADKCVAPASVNKDWLAIPNAMKEELYAKGVVQRPEFIAAGAGAIVAWRSRTLHCNRVAGKGGGERAAVYISYHSAHHVGVEALAERRRIALLQLTSNHCVPRPIGFPGRPNHAFGFPKGTKEPAGYTGQLVQFFRSLQIMPLDNDVFKKLITLDEDNNEKSSRQPCRIVKRVKFSDDESADAKTGFDLNASRNG
jgi:hypothetical protein